MHYSSHWNIRQTKTFLLPLMEYGKLCRNFWVLVSVVAWHLSDSVGLIVFTYCPQFYHYKYLRCSYHGTCFPMLLLMLVNFDTDLDVHSSRFLKTFFLKSSYLYVVGTFKKYLRTVALIHCLSIWGTKPWCFLWAQFSFYIIIIMPVDGATKLLLSSKIRTILSVLKIIYLELFLQRCDGFVLQFFSIVCRQKR